MKFENVKILIDTLTPELKSDGMTIEKDGKTRELQSGILRTNCMDCLDRTNVVQSACGQWALEQQMEAEGFAMDLRTDISTQGFNSLWADNGDAISKQYSSTAALKGDYTRTRKRDYRGALNDLGLTLGRYFNNIVNDDFSQATIDFLLGNVTDQVFEEFEATMMSSDPAMSMPKVHQSAIDTSAKIVIADPSEEMLLGWTLLSPHDSNTIKSMPFEEVVLLLTYAALYAVRFDWNMEKVSSFERVSLTSVVSITHGAYITSTLANTQMDEARNVGLVVRYRPGKKDIERVNTRSLSTAAPSTRPLGSYGDSMEPDQPSMPKSDGSKRTGLKVLAFKAPSTRAAVATGIKVSALTDEQALVATVCKAIALACADPSTLILEEDIISLPEAKRSTGLWEHWSHSLKKLVWA